MNEEFYPNTQFGQKLLDSIPAKVYAMLVQAEIDPYDDLHIVTKIDEKGNPIYSLEVDMEPIEGGTLKFFVEKPFEEFTLTWDGSAHEPFATGCTNKIVENIEQNLSKFVEYESLIYGLVEQYIEEYNEWARGDIQALSADGDAGSEE